MLLTRWLSLSLTYGHPTGTLASGQGACVTQTVLLPFFSSSACKLGLGHCCPDIMIPTSRENCRPFLVSFKFFAPIVFNFSARMETEEPEGGEGEECAVLSDKPGLSHCSHALGLLLTDGLGMGNGCIGPILGNRQLLFPFAESSKTQSCHTH